MVDDHGPAIIDSDGLRIPIPVPPAGGVLVRSVSVGSSSGFGSSPTTFWYYVADRDGRALARIPGDTLGFDDEALQDFARAAGLGFTEVIASPTDAPGYSEAVDFFDCLYDRDYRRTRKSRFNRLLRYEGKNSPYREPYKSLYPAVKPPYELPELEIPSGGTASG